MIIEDHISSLVPSPLRGRNIDSLGVRFPDMSDVYSKRLRKIIAECAMENGIETKKGVYIQLQAPHLKPRRKSGCAPSSGRTRSE
jgi:purine-nucleoside phosphorylase